MRSLLDIEILLELTRRSIDFVISFTQEDLDVDLLMEMHLGIGVDENIG